MTGPPSVTTRAILMTVLALAPAAPASAAAIAEPASLAVVLEAVRQGIGYEEIQTHTGGVLASGEARFLGTVGRMTLLLSPDGRIRRNFAGPVKHATGFDGRTAWEVDWSGLPRVLELEDRERQMIVATLVTGAWLGRRSPLSVTPLADRANDDEIVMEVGVPGGTLRGELVIDRYTWQPTRLVLPAAAGEQTWHFESYRNVLGFDFPHRIRTTEARGEVTSFTVERVAPAPIFIRDPYVLPSSRPGDTCFEPEVGPAVPIRRARSGHLLVRPRIDEVDVGWFILDSGSGAMVISPDVADGLGLEPLGAVTAVGVGGPVTTRLRRGGTFTLGPATVTDMSFIELDLDFLEPFFGLEVAGICGYDFFGRVVVELDIETAEATIHPTDEYVLADPTQWLAIEFDARMPCVRATYEGDRDGLFRIDTGSASAVTFNASAVRGLDLLAGRDTTEMSMGGIGGRRVARQGRLSFFELAGHRFADVLAEFEMADGETLPPRPTQGTIGGALLEPFRVVFDYAGRRMAFVEKRERGKGAEGQRGKGTVGRPVGGDTEVEP